MSWSSARHNQIIVAAIVFCGLAASPAFAQLGILTSTIGTGQINDSSDDWLVGSSIEENDRIVTSADSFAMVFFVSGLGGAEIEFDGTIVVEIDQNTEILIRRGSGRRPPIDVHVIKGRVRAFFDAGEHKDFILLSTPQGILKVTGSIIYATHDLPEEPGISVLGSFDSDCRATLVNDQSFDISQFQKVVIQEGVEARVAGMTVEDISGWESFPDLNMASAFAHRGQVRTAYAGRTWVGEYVTSEERLEDVAGDSSSNIPSQEPEVASSTTTVLTRTTTTTPQTTQPALRASNSGRRVGEDDDGIGRETLSRQRLRNLRK